MPFESDKQRRKCYEMDDPNWDCKKYAKGEDAEGFDDAVERVIQQTERTKVDPSNPEVHVPGLGVWTVNTLKDSLIEHIEEIGQRGGSSKSQHNTIRAKLDTLLKAEKEMAVPIYKGKITRHRNKDIS